MVTESNFFLLLSIAGVVWNSKVAWRGCVHVSFRLLQCLRDMDNPRPRINIDEQEEYTIIM